MSTNKFILLSVQDYIPDQANYLLNFHQFHVCRFHAWYPSIFAIFYFFSLGDVWGF